MGWTQCIGNNGGGGSASLGTELVCLNCVGRDVAEIPQVDSLEDYNDYSSYLSFDTTTRKFTVLQSFTAIFTGWVRNYALASSSYSKGQIILNNNMIANYTVNSKTVDVKAGTTLTVPLSQGDEFWVYTPNDDGYPEQHLKVYKTDYLTQDINDILSFSDEGAST